jgi:molybdate transport system substrate-binding protein
MTFRSHCSAVRAALLTALLVLGLAPGAQAAEIRVLAAGAVKAAMEQVAPQFERATGHTVHASYDTVGAQRDRVLKADAGAVADVVILSDSAIAQLRSASRLTGAAALPIGQVAVSLAVPHGAPVPDISSAAALKQALENAPTLAYADPARGATAGTHFDKVLQQLGLKDSLAARITVLPFGVDVIKDVSVGKYAVGVSQSSEILQHEGITMVGPLPAPYALTTGYSAAAASALPAAQALLDFLAQPPALQRFRASGFLAQ